MSLKSGARTECTSNKSHQTLQGGKFCQVCGEATRQVADGQTIAPAETSETRMLFLRCGRCGNGPKNGADFCDYCGADFAVVDLIGPDQHTLKERGLWVDPIAATTVFAVPHVERKPAPPVHELHPPRKARPTFSGWQIAGGLGMVLIFVLIGWYVSLQSAQRELANHLAIVSNIELTATASARGAAVNEAAFQENLNGLAATATTFASQPTPTARVDTFVVTATPLPPTATSTPSPTMAPYGKNFASALQLYSQPDESSLLRILTNDGFEIVGRGGDTGWILVSTRNGTAWARQRNIEGLRVAVPDDLPLVTLQSADWGFSPTEVITRDNKILAGTIYGFENADAKGNGQVYLHNGAQYVFIRPADAAGGIWVPGSALGLDFSDFADVTPRPTPAPAPTTASATSTKPAQQVRVYDAYRYNYNPAVATAGNGNDLIIMRVNLPGGYDKYLTKPIGLIIDGVGSTARSAAGGRVGVGEGRHTVQLVQWKGGGKFAVISEIAVWVGHAQNVTVTFKGGTIPVR